MNIALIVLACVILSYILITPIFRLLAKKINRIDNLGKTDSEDKLIVLFFWFVWPIMIPVMTIHVLINIKVLPTIDNKFTRYIVGE